MGCCFAKEALEVETSAVSLLDIVSIIVKTATSLFYLVCDAFIFFYENYTLKHANKNHTCSKT